MDPVVIVAAARTPLGAFNGKLRSTSAVELGKIVVRKVVEDYNVKIDSVYMGCVLSAGLGQSAARQAAIGAGLSESVNCVNVNKICGSGMAAIMLARNAIISGENDVVVAGGMESMTNAPYLLEKARFGYRFGEGKVIDHIMKDGLMDAYEKCVMGWYAEDTASAYSFGREDQDEYAAKSFIKARKAVENGTFEREIVSVAVKDKKSETIVDRDEIPFSVDLAKMPHLKPPFRENGTITAASSSSISDGAAAVLMMKESKAEKMGLVPFARIVAQSSFSQAPKLFTTAPIGAIKQVLEKSKWHIKDVDLFEINEAFAIVAMAAIKEFSLDPETVNVFGGACAIGHPLGASGARIIVTLLNAMETRNARNGLAALCVGGGEGVAITLEKAT
ncbi:MAG: thiolase family protein [Holosporaceae bacterium]|jgi:acetyl-CoA C-acetyltransferase|nr:thiolase family protein [Holosporaceae bacterium]